MSRIAPIARCGQPVPDGIRRYAGECCVLVEGHKSSHRSLGIGSRETGDGPRTWPNADSTQIMVKDVRRIVRKAGLPTSRRAASRNWSWITREGAMVDRWGDQIVRVMWRDDGSERRSPTGYQSLLQPAAKALTEAGYHVYPTATGMSLLVAHRVLSPQELT